MYQYLIPLFGLFGGFAFVRYDVYGKIKNTMKLINAMEGRDSGGCSQVITISDKHAGIKYSQNGQDRLYLFPTVSTDTLETRSLHLVNSNSDGDFFTNITPPTGVRVSYNMNDFIGFTFRINGEEVIGNIVDFPPDDEEEIFE